MQPGKLRATKDWNETEHRLGARSLGPTALGWVCPLGVAVCVSCRCQQPHHGPRIVHSLHPLEQPQCSKKSSP